MPTLVAIVSKWTYSIWLGNSIYSPNGSQFWLGMQLWLPSPLPPFNDGIVTSVLTCNQCCHARPLNKMRGSGAFQQNSAGESQWDSPWISWNQLISIWSIFSNRPGAPRTFMIRFDISSLDHRMISAHVSILLYHQSLRPVKKGYGKGNALPRFQLSRTMRLASVLMFFGVAPLKLLKSFPFEIGIR